MTADDLKDARNAIETVRADPRRHDPDVRLQLRLADLLVRAVDEVERRDRSALTPTLQPDHNALKG